MNDIDRMTAPQPPAEAQAQGGGEVVAQQQGQTVYQIENDPDEWFDVGQDMYEGHDGSRKRILYTTVTPQSAPVEVDEVAAFEAWARCQFKGAEAFDRIDGRPGGWEYNGDMVQAAWAAWQQRSCLAQQPAAVDEESVEQVASAIAIEDTGVSWHDVSPRDRTHYVRLARAALAAQPGGSDNDQ